MDVLIVDDDDALRGVVRNALERAGFTVREASDGERALRVIEELAPDLVVLDVGMPRLDGSSVCRQIRDDLAPNLPIIFLTARDDEVDRILGLELAGDDYVTKPFSPRELASRVKAVLRRTVRTEEREGMVRQDVRVDEDARRAWVRDQLVNITATEFDLLVILICWWLPCRCCCWWPRVWCVTSFAR